MGFIMEETYSKLKGHSHKVAWKEYMIRVNSHKGYTWRQPNNLYVLDFHPLVDAYRATN